MKNERRFGPGPYAVAREKDGVDDMWNIYTDGQDMPIAGVAFWSDSAEWAERSRATAKLFAAAPEMLDALELAEACLQVAVQHYERTVIRRVIREAVAKALDQDNSDH